MLKGDGGPIVAQKKRKRERKRERRGMKEGRFEEGFGQVQGCLEKWEGRGRWGRGGGGGEVRGEFKVVGEGKGQEHQVLCHGGIAKGEGGVGEDFRWMVLGGKEKGGGVVVDFVVGVEVGEGMKRLGITGHPNLKSSPKSPSPSPPPHGSVLILARGWTCRHS